MEVFLSVLSVAGIILGAVLLIMIISFLLSAILYESVFGKRFEIYDSAHLPDLNDYKGLVNEPVTFPSKRGYKYTGFYYHDESYDSFRGLIVFSHGIFDGQLSYLPEIAYFARRGYKIFAFDNSGSHLSGGKSLRGLPQSAEDLDAALSYVTKTNTLPLYLFGHSWGGYAVSAVHCYHLYDIKAVFVQSGFDQTSEMVLEEGSAMMGRWIYILRAYIKLYERMKYGKAAGSNEKYQLKVTSTDWDAANGSLETLLATDGKVGLAGGSNNFYSDMVQLLGNIKMTDGRVAATQTVKDLDSVYINEDGTIYGIHSVHGIIMLGRIDIVTFDNPNGLEQVGSSYWRETLSSGQPQVNIAGENGSASVVSGALEMSNVDLSQEFSDMIITQRGFQANSRIITTSDTMLEEIVNLKR